MKMLRLISTTKSVQMDLSVSPFAILSVYTCRWGVNRHDLKVESMKTHTPRTPKKGV